MTTIGSQRRQFLLSVVRDTGGIEVGDLADRLGVSPETVRRDLTHLEEQGLVRRTHGAVHPLDNAGYESSLEFRSAHMVPEKRRIAEAAAGLIGQASSVFIDDGFTTRLVGEVLAAQDRNLTVITPSLPLAISLAGAARTEVILLGGRVRRHSLGTIGHWVTDMLTGLLFDVAILGTNGISPERGLTTPSPESSDLKSKVMARTRRRLLVGVHTKFGMDSFARFAAVEDFEALVTDRGLSAREAQRYGERGPRVVRV